MVYETWGDVRVKYLLMDPLLSILQALMESVSKHKHRLTPLIILQIWIYANDDKDDAARASYDTKKNDDEVDAVMHNVT